MLRASTSCEVVFWAALEVLGVSSKDLACERCAVCEHGQAEHEPEPETKPEPETETKPEPSSADIKPIEDDECKLMEFSNRVSSNWKIATTLL